MAELESSRHGTGGSSIQVEKPSNVIDAAADGASKGGVSLAINVGGMLLAFIALIALLNGILGLVGGFVGIEALSLEMILGYLFSPLA